MSALQACANMASARPELWGMTLANTTLGEKRACPECGAKFYDLGKRPAVCPKCKTMFDPGGTELTILRPENQVKTPTWGYDSPFPRYACYRSLECLRGKSCLTQSSFFGKVTPPSGKLGLDILLYVLHSPIVPEKRRNATVF